MKRTMMALALLCFACLALLAVAGAQSHSSVSKAATAKGPKSGLEIRRMFHKKLKCPEKEQDRVRETAVLRMDAANYQEFTNNPEKFVNDHKVFSCQIGADKKLEHLVRQLGPKKAIPPGADPDVTVVHDLDCGGFWFDGGIS